MAAMGVMSRMMWMMLSAMAVSARISEERGRAREYRQEDPGKTETFRH
jgi:hypothetical protein